MSAIVAAAGAPLSPETRTWVAEATELSSRAGPGGTAVHLEERFGLGHAWLRTSTTETSQPITLDGRTWLSAYARFDGRGSLMAALRARRCNLSETLSDAELLLHAYDTWGDRFLEHLEGDFSFALWDGPGDRLICARDQLGITPLHYARAGGELLVASSLDALRLHPAVSERLDETSLADFLINGHYEDFGATAFRDIRRLPPAHGLGWSGGTLRMWCYWQLPDWEPLVRLAKAQDYADRFGALLDEAVADRVTTDRLAVHLSGGMDSTSIAASALVALRARGAPVGSMRALTITLGGATGDQEGEFAALVAAELGIVIDLVDGSAMKPLDPNVNPVVVTPEPTPYRWTELESELARAPARHAPVALSGHGGDALLWFNPWYWAEWLAKGQVPRLARAFYEKERLFGTRLHPSIRAGAARKWAARTVGPRPLPTWLSLDFAARTKAAERRAERPPPASNLDARGLVGDPFWSNIFTWGDPSFTGLPVRFRYPFLDLRLLRFVRGLPPDPWLRNKRVLRDATLSRLPPAVRQRPKTPLVEATLPGHTDEVIDQLARMVREAPDLDRFVSREALVSDLIANGAAAVAQSDRALSHPLGLAYWLLHSSMPVAPPVRGDAA